MTEGMFYYYTLNQLLCGKSYSQLDRALKDFLEAEGLDVTYKDCMSQERKVLSEVEQTFLNYIRVPGYTFNLSGAENTPLSLEQVAKVVRDKDVPTSGSYHWATYLIAGFDENSCAATRVMDGMLSLSAAVAKKQPDLMKAMECAFCMYCWGVPSERSKDYKAWLKTLVDVVRPKGDVSLTKDKAVAIFDGFIRHNVNPRDIGLSVVFVADVAPMLKEFRCIAFWTDVERTTVSVIIPRASSKTTIVEGVLPVLSFRQIATDDPESLVTMCAKGESVSFGKVTK